MCSVEGVREGGLAAALGRAKGSGNESQMVLQSWLAPDAVSATVSALTTLICSYSLCLVRRMILILSLLKSPGHFLELEEIQASINIIQVN